MGEAAGMASAQVVKKSVSFADIDVRALRGKLKGVNAIVDRDQLPEIRPRVDQF
jgi:hypothetical protein